MLLGRFGKKVIDYSSTLSFYRGKRVFVTGHTGFKGSWLCRILVDSGAIVTGYSLEPPTTPSLFALSGIQEELTSVIDDVRDYDALCKAFSEAKPDIVLHLAAQPLVRESYKNPRDTYETNVMGTVNILECVRTSKEVRSVLNVTTDKVYQNNEWVWGYKEVDPLDGHDPYSNSKSCSELVTHSYNKCFFAASRVAVSTARAGNVIGGGDFATDRIIPDCIRAARDGSAVVVRNPSSTRPYQHVLEPLFAYLYIAKRQYEDISYAGYYNVGPDDCDCIDTGSLVSLFCETWNSSNPGLPVTWVNKSDGGPHEANFLKLDCSLLKARFDWTPRWRIDKAIDKTIEWVRAWKNGQSISECMSGQIQDYVKGL